MCSMHDIFFDDEYASLVAEPPTDTERTAVYKAVADCDWRTSSELVDHWHVLALLRLEPALGIPATERGLLPAVWCIEASMRTEMRGGGLIRGDYRAGRGYLSQGPFQITDRIAEVCGGDEERHNIIWAARCWVANIHRVLPKSKARCPKRAWVVAEAMVSNPRTYQWRCNASSKHYQLVGR